MAGLGNNLLSVVIPLYNESESLLPFNKSLVGTLQKAGQHNYEVIYCDDGSTDDTAELVNSLCVDDARIKLLELTRNFGKENTLSAGIAEASGRAIIMIDGDGQHPVELIPEFIKAWENGSQVVIGVRTDNQGEGWFKRIGSRVFHRLFNMISEDKLIVGSTDFRLIDQSVRREFLNLKETDRITRGLIDWLGFRRSYIPFKAAPRQKGSPSYDKRSLMRLATHSFVSLTPGPLYLFGYLGIFITTVALILGSSVFVEQIVMGDPLHWKFTGTAMLSILILFLVGLVLLSQGILSLYVSHIHSQSKQRPLYIVDRKRSVGIKDEDDPK
jgi:dolichol-phosphate mannosyltransferase